MANYRRSIFAIFILAFLSWPIRAQYLGDQLVGITGLQSGSQPPPGFYLSLPAFFRDSSVSIYDAQGNRVAKNATADINLVVVPGIEVITPWKILGAHYGAAITQWVTNGDLTAANTNFHRTTNYGFGDLYIQPVILGWHAKHADFTAGYALFAPTGIGAAGHQMWVNEIDFGTTLYFDSEKSWNLSTTAYYDFNRKKNDSNVKVGDILTINGGFGKQFHKGMFNIGASYGGQWKITHDVGADIPAFLPISNGRVFGLGPEADIRVFEKGVNFGMFSFRYLWPIGPKTSLTGDVMMASFTLGHVIPR